MLAEISAKESDAESVVIGMPHRGRLSTLILVQEYPLRNLLYKIAGNNDIPADISFGLDDIPSHISISNNRRFASAEGGLNGQKEFNVTMVHNPSHLEAQNAVSMGKTRAKQDDFPHSDPSRRRRVINFQGHGDAAFPS